MPITTFKIAPGVNAEVTATQGIAQIVQSQAIRFKFAGNEILPEKLGGWTRYWPTPVSAAPRALHAWEGLNFDTHLAIGTATSLNVITDGAQIENITPETYTSTIAPAFSTASGSAVVQIDDTNITASEFDSIFLVTPVAIDGLVLQGAYAIETVLSSTSYTIIASSDAASTTGPAGAVPVFTTTSGSSAINVELPNHGYTVGTVFPAGVPTSVGGLTIYGAYIVQQVIDADNFVIFSSAEASSSTSADMNGGDAEIIYFLGGAPPPLSTGYGVGGYGTGGYGTGSAITPTPGTPITATNWSLDNWGEILIATPANQAIYTWSPDSGFPIATKIVTAPLINGGSFVAQPEQILVAWASSQNGVQDPLSINWSDSGNFNQWAVTSQTQAGGYRIPTGSKIVGGVAGPNFNVIWTDLEAWAMDYIGAPLVFGFRTVGQACGLLSQHGYSAINSTLYWISNNKFCQMVGEDVQTIPCTVWDYIFQDLDTANQDKICCATNSLFGEVSWFFPSASGGTGEVDSYVKYNIDLQTWDCGRLSRTAWIDQSPVGPPVGGGPNGYVYQHETSPNADGQPLTASLQTGFFQINDGDLFQFVDWMFPDFKWGYQGTSGGASLSVTIYFCDYPNQSVKTAGPFSVSQALQYVNLRLRGRFIAVKIESSDLDSWWRLGALKFRNTTDGKQ